ncbi:paired amphipathic helix protein Sin3-like protein 2 isoform X1 [Tanacetum coccineum]
MKKWIKCREDFNKVWADIYAKNHYKSLDHRSFYFKQQDSKDLSTKCLVAEIKETKEKSQKDDDVLYSVAAGKVCSTKEQVNQVLKLWTTYLEPMLYVPSRPENFDNVEDVEISTRGATTNEGESDGSPGVDSVTFNNVKQGKPACNGDDNVSPKIKSRFQAIAGDYSRKLHPWVNSIWVMSQREDHEDGDHDDLDGKAESEGEAEGIEDANFISADSTYSDHILQSTKPLAKRVASPLHDGGKKDCNIFYGNESFYVLFQLHQDGHTSCLIWVAFHSKVVRGYVLDKQYPFELCV